MRPALLSFALDRFGSLGGKEVAMKTNTVHRTTIIAKCPHGGPDVYEAEFHTASLLTVETIQAEIDEATREPIYQEHLTIRLAEKLECAVVTIGRHGRFQTECRVEN